MVSAILSDLKLVLFFAFVLLCLNHCNSFMLAWLLVKQRSQEIDNLLACEFRLQ